MSLQNPEKEVLQREAVAAFSAGDFATCWDRTQKLLRMPPVSASVHEMLGIMLLNAGRGAEAYASFRQVASASPQNPVNQLRLAFAADAAGDVESASIAIQRAILLAPGEPPIYLQASGTYWRSGKEERAFDLLSHVLTLQPDNRQALGARAQMLFQRGRKQEVQRCLMREAVLAPETGANNILFADTFRAANWPSMAERLYRRQCKFGAPGDPESWRNLAYWLIERRQADRAIGALRHQLCLEPANAEAWSKLAFCNESAVPKCAADLSVLAAAHCAPYNGMFWIDVARQFADRLSVSDRAGCAVAMAAKCAVAAPYVRFKLAMFFYELGNRAEAAEYMFHFFRDMHHKTLNGELDADSGQAAVEFLNYILLRQRPAACVPFLAHIDSTIKFDSVADVGLRKIGLLAGLDADYCKAPHDWSCDERRIISLPIWGSSHVDMWLKWGLPSLLAGGNEKYWQGGETAVHILTTPEDWERMKRSDVFGELQARATVIFLDLSPVIRNGLTFGSYIAMSLGHWASINIARSEKADFIGLVADYVFSDGSLGYVADAIAAGRFDAAFTIDLPVQDSALEDFALYRQSGGALEIPSRAMVDVFLNHPSSRVSAYEVGPGIDSALSDPSRLNLRLADGWRIYTMQPQLFYLRASLSAEVWVSNLPATDNGVADACFAALGSPEKMRILTDPDQFCCSVVEAGDEGRLEKGYFAVRHETADPIAELVAQIRRSGFASPARIWGLEHGLDAISSGESGIDTEQRDWIEDLIQSIPAGFELGQNFARQVGLPSFERYLEWCEPGPLP
ncbi:hypothetical protein NUH88_08145 [Nisaea acidiphila]|uniref:Tetratricopeptide repeat protein n=1 Tax=Nisaea acidiphila TaxID=1862145 RepID=A0A9J7AV69_9PROT|nr:tetratricopeptide repeat protein [Nisaea acidiphila]UUX51659.1 hypothetical protein NUH88_08145 [Nisaea acidiphila]